MIATENIKYIFVLRKEDQEILITDTLSKTKDYASQAKVIKNRILLKSIGEDVRVNFSMPDKEVWYGLTDSNGCIHCVCTSEGYREALANQLLDVRNPKNNRF